MQELIVLFEFMSLPAGGEFRDFADHDRLLSGL
jgi:hypothetical protein